MRSRYTPLLLAAAVLAVPLAAGAQTVHARATEPEPDPHHIVRVDLGLELVNRTFELNGPSEVLFDAPFYRGLRVAGELFPVAIFAAESPAAGIGFQFQTAKHVLNTVAAYELDGETYDFDVPTRHDVTKLALIYEWSVANSVTITPSIALHTVEFSLGYNPLYRNSYYRGVELGGRLDYELKVDGLSLGGGVRVRPGVDLGSTVRPYGSTSSSFGLGIDAGMRYVSRLGLYGLGEFRYDRYATTYRPDRNEDRDDSKSTDQFRGFVFALGYAY